MAGDQQPGTPAAIAGAAPHAAPEASASPPRPPSVFISYARKDRDAADALVKILEIEGFDAWIDREDIRDGFRAAIETALGKAAAVVVLWSERSAVSDYVLDEASRGRERRVLVAARVDDVRLPLGFGGLHTYDLRDWDRESHDHVELRRLLDRIKELAGGTGRDARSRVYTLSRTAMRSVVAALGALLLLGWMGYRLSLAIPAIVGVFMGSLAGAQYLLGRGATVRAAARRVCSKAWAIPLLVLGLAAWSFVPIEIDAGKNPPSVLTAEVLSANGSIAGPTSIASEGRARLWVGVPPTGRALTLRVSGHADLPYEVRPWSRARLVLGTDIAALPTLLVRLGPEETGKVNGAHLEILEGGIAIGGAGMTSQHGAAMFGPERLSLPSLLPAWRNEIRGEVAEASREEFLALWLKPAVGTWVRPPSSVFATIRVRLTTRAGAKWISQPISLRGEVTDEKFSLQEEH